LYLDRAETALKEKNVEVDALNHQVSELRLLQERVAKILGNGIQSSLNASLPPEEIADLET
jgi:hypothetical protein